jgi:hypothetical protein
MLEDYVREAVTCTFRRTSSPVDELTTRAPESMSAKTDV